jgi:hypothetical protein
MVQDTWRLFNAMSINQYLDSRIDFVLFRKMQKWHKQSPLLFSLSVETSAPFTTQYKSGEKLFHTLSLEELNPRA